MGMGYAYTAISNDVFGMFFNPAGLAGAPFTQVSGSIQRIPSDVGFLSQETFAYTRPFPILPGSTVGAAYADLKQLSAGSKRQLLGHFSTTLNLQKYYIPKPVKVGANLKFSSINPESLPHKFTPALDFGAIMEPGWDMAFGVSVTDLGSSVGVPTPTIAFGGSYRYKRRMRFATDVRIRSGLTEFYPGVEIDFMQRLLKLRLGRGVSLDTIDTLAVGLGLNYSPLILDMGFMLPSKGRTAAGTGVQVSVTWTFGAPPFYWRFPGDAARTAGDLRGEILELKKQVRDMRSNRDAADANKTSLEGQVEAEEDRLRDLQRQSRDLEYELQKRRYDRDHPEPGDPLLSSPESIPDMPAGIDNDAAVDMPAGIDSAPPPTVVAPKPEKTRKRRRRSKFPKRHRVRAGDTLRKLAEKYYGDPALWEAIYEANPDRIERGLPVEGKTLLIPKPMGR